MKKKPGRTKIRKRRTAAKAKKPQVKVRDLKPAKGAKRNLLRAFKY